MTKDEAIAQVLTTALDAAKKTGAWLSDQVPDVLHQLIVWNIAQDIFLLVMAVTMLSVYAASVHRFASRFTELVRSYEVNDAPFLHFWIVWLISGGIASLISLISVPINGLDLIELLVAPKVWLLEYAAHLVK